MKAFIVEFDLSSKSPVMVEKGEVITDKGYPTVTVRDVKANSTDEAVAIAKSKAEIFLNELSWRHGINLQISTGWSVGPYDSFETRHIKQTRIVVRLKGGHRPRYPKTIEAITGKESAAKAYWRKAQLSQDTFDKFRNLYLAIENVASKIVTAKNKQDVNDFELLRTALHERFASDEQTLIKHSHVRGFKHTGDIIEEVTELLYKGYRCELNHSKEEREKKVPFDYESEEEVSSVLHLTEFVARSVLEYEDEYL